ncbi:MAG: hypothetical protein CSA81_08915 [Acidobacteria bacterium]|nr:MAG: hypothetical protein CSA81_08915 [Acidobacteriota bacterium]
MTFSKERDLEALLDAMPKAELDIHGQIYDIPMGQPLLRGLQYIQFKGARLEVTRGPFCWNGDCRSCVCDVESAGVSKRNQRICRYRVKGDVKITKINKNFVYKADR